MLCAIVVCIIRICFGLVPCWFYILEAKWRSGQLVQMFRSFDVGFVVVVGAEVVRPPARHFLLLRHDNLTHLDVTRMLVKVKMQLGFEIWSRFLLTTLSRSLILQQMRRNTTR